MTLQQFIKVSHLPFFLYHPAMQRHGLGLTCAFCNFWRRPTIHNPTIAIICFHIWLFLVTVVKESAESALRVPGSHTTVIFQSRRIPTLPLHLAPALPCRATPPKVQLNFCSEASPSELQRHARGREGQCNSIFIMMDDQGQKGM